MTTELKTDVVIIGGGLGGVAAALAAAPSSSSSSSPSPSLIPRRDPSLRSSSWLSTDFHETKTQIAMERPKGRKECQTTIFSFFFFFVEVLLFFFRCSRKRSRKIDDADDAAQRER